jgi:hypothetical protein
MPMTATAISPTTTAIWSAARVTSGNFLANGREM